MNLKIPLLFGDDALKFILNSSNKKNKIRVQHIYGYESTFETWLSH